MYQDKRREGTMTAFNVVRFRVKAGFEDEFEAIYKSLARDFPGVRNFALVRNEPRDEDDAKDGFAKYFAIGEWESFDNIKDARPKMGANLDRFRHTLVDHGEGKGITDAISGKTVYEKRISGG
jgi:heme-degrading monooxygenase HmoA